MKLQNIISIYNNKGGVGKSTLTVGLAEFLAGNLDHRVLVIDLDAQASSSGAVLGREAVIQASKRNQTLPALCRAVLNKGQRFDSLSSFIVDRPASTSRGTALARLSVIVPNKPEMLELDESMTTRDILKLRDNLRPALAQYEYVLIDFPGNISRRDKLAVAMMVLSSFIVIPVEPTDMALNALPDTLEMIGEAKKLSESHYPAILGLVLNKTDKRYQQFKDRTRPIIEASEDGNLPPVFRNHLPPAPTLATATDGHIDWSTLKQRFDTYYDHIRRIAKELDQRCKEFTLPPPSQTPQTWMNRILSIFAGQKKIRK